jgi:dephospho-CoA kinase
VTGNISSGKSTVAKALEQHGAVVVDADQLARDVVEAGTKTLERLVGAFGEEILQSDGSLNRERLGQMVFADTKVRATLNQIVHPEIARKSIAVLQRLRERDDIPLVVYEAPLLFEVGAETRVDKVLVVKIDSKEQLKRLMSRDHLGEVEAKQRIAAQMSQDKKLARADYVIDNSGTISDVLLQVEKLWPKLVGKNGV